MSGNLGQTSLRRKRRAYDPMRDYDALPGPLRQWLRDAAMPWSPRSCRRIWQRARARGADMAEVLAVLTRVEQGMLARERAGQSDDRG